VLFRDLFFSFLVFVQSPTLGLCTKTSLKHPVFVQNIEFLCKIARLVIVERGATEALSRLANSFARSILKEGDESGAKLRVARSAKKANSF
jgi:hypothetical protein